jgi:hypothetical protein
MGVLRRPAAALVIALGLLLAVGPAVNLAAQAPPYSPTVTVRGLVSASQTYALDELQSLAAEELTVEVVQGGAPRQATYRGVPLHALLLATGLEIGPPQPGDPLRLYVVVTGTDGYQVVVAWGEIDPGFEGKNVLVAYQRDGQLLGEGQGMAQLVVPGDQRAGRFVRNVESLTLLRADAP